MKQLGFAVVGFGFGLLVYAGWVSVRDRGGRGTPAERRAVLGMLVTGVVLVAAGVALVAAGT